MKSSFRGLFLVFAALPISLFVLPTSGCQQARNFTTYYNRFWNMERIMEEVEDDVGYVREQSAASQPRYVVPLLPVGKEFSSRHLTRRTLDPDEVRRHKIKLDSILLKGSILLTHQNESDYVDDAIFYISKTYFYEREWFQSASQARELIALFPESKWQPDAHLVLAMDLLMLGEIDEAEEMLSRTVDVAFRFERQDILTEAFRLNADVALWRQDPGSAARPYERAILLSDDGEEQAAWQYDLGIVYFRAGEYERAIEAFDRIDEYDPTDVTRFEAGLQKGVALRALERYDEADAQLSLLEEDGDFEDFGAPLAVERSVLAAARSGGDLYDPAVIDRLDSLGATSYLLSAYFEQGVRLFRAGDYPAASTSFSKVQTTDNEFNREARSYTVWIGYYREERAKAEAATRIAYVEFPDSLAIEASRAFYNVSRFFSRYDIKDSAEIYLRKAVEIGPKGSTDRAKATWALSDFLFLKGTGAEADALLVDLAENYGDNEWSAEARRRLSYTDEIFPDAARDLYTAGRSLMENAGDYRAAIVRFRRVWQNHAGSVYAPRALYATGLIFEEDLNEPDSALYYYAFLLNRYGGTDQAEAVRSLVETTMAGGPVIDTTEGGLIPLDSLDGTTITDGTDSVAEEKPWFDNRLYEPNTTLALERRRRRTGDIKE